MTRNSKRPAERRANQLPNKLRIIAGRWRGVPISFPPQPGLRPTPDRVRETLFNWLQPAIVDARCLDLFAGSGALAFEALSRGAREVVCVERDREVVRHLEDTAKRLLLRAPAPAAVGSPAQQLRAEGFDAIASDALAYLSGPARAFDIVFLDPPYASDVLKDVLPRLTQGWLAPNALIYLEAPAEAGLPPLPSGWSVHRSKSAGQVGYHLLRAS
jgi:16S rRNA (guanine966-N2)-methyltransferase